MRFSIITVTLNAENTIRDTIESILGQSYDEFEYIIVDGMSSDQTMEIISGYQREDKRIKCISGKDDGIYDAMNKGISMALGDYVAILNSGDYFEPDSLKIINNNIQEESDYQIIYGMTRIVDNDDWQEITMRSHKFLHQGMICHQSVFVSRKIYADYGCYDLKYKYVADYDFMVRMSLEKNILFTPVFEIVVNYRAGGVSMSLEGKKEYLNFLGNRGFIPKKSFILQKIKLAILGG